MPMTLRTWLRTPVMAVALVACAMPPLPPAQSPAGDRAGGSGPAARAVPGAPSADMVEAGLRAALETGIDRVARRLGRRHGYWQDDRIRIPLPGRLAEVQKTLSGTPLAVPLDDLQWRMNQAAEAAVPAGQEIIRKAIMSMSLADALGLLRGGETAATDLLRRTTAPQLRAAFAPYVARSLADSGAFRALDEVTASWPLLAGAAADYKTGITGHAVRFGLDGLFLYLGEEERRIRRDPAARTSELLIRVFGS